MKMVGLTKNSVIGYSLALSFVCCVLPAILHVPKSFSAEASSNPIKMKLDLVTNTKKLKLGDKLDVTLIFKNVSNDNVYFLDPKEATRFLVDGFELKHNSLDKACRSDGLLEISFDTDVSSIHLLRPKETLSYVITFEYSNENLFVVTNPKFTRWEGLSLKTIDSAILIPKRGTYELRYHYKKPAPYKIKEFKQQGFQKRLFRGEIESKSLVIEFS